MPRWSPVTPLPPTGTRFGRRVVLAVGKYAYGMRHLQVRCDCGRVDDVPFHALKAGLRNACSNCARHKLPPRITHGESAKPSTSPEYHAWSHIKDRCYNPNDKKYHLYGGRGIQMCSEWNADFSKFLSDMGRRPSHLHSIDRIDPDGHYERVNCRWATSLEQAHNQRSNVHVEYDGRRLTLAEWSRETGIPGTTLSNRIRKGWPVDIALTRPPSKRNPKRGRR